MDSLSFGGVAFVTGGGGSMLDILDSMKATKSLGLATVSSMLTFWGGLSSLGGLLSLGFCQGGVSGLRATKSPGLAAAFHTLTLLAGSCLFLRGEMREGAAVRTPNSNGSNRNPKKRRGDPCVPRGRGLPRRWSRRSKI
jgi:hypothetical protein